MPSDLAQIEKIFSKALEKGDVAERVAYLNEACQADVELRERVEALLAAHADADNILRLQDNEATVSFVPVTERPGSTIGRYKLLEQIGEGGFGVVFMAEQEQPVRRRVALKIIKAGMDTKQVVARFEAERQALAMMEHPNIAKVLDAGATDTGRPYFVMELVRGIPITEYCNKSRLSTEQRLTLFQLVCSAVQHAHQKGIIHRDIKPSNVLVTMHDDKAVPKVIDFGVAKATQGRLTERTLFTEFRQMVGTPTYMSPEQAQFSGLDVDTRSDIYSLGVLLYELLTGTTPLEMTRIASATYDELRRFICEEEPPAPSARLSSLSNEVLTSLAQQRQCEPSHLAVSLKNDLDWIVMRCLEKDRTRRYATANSLAEDIEHFLNNEPVVARAPTTAYRIKKYVRRNRALLSTLGLVITLLMTGTVISTWQAIRARRAEEGVRQTLNEVRMQRDRANKERDRAILAEQKIQKALEEAQYERIRADISESHGRVRDMLGNAGFTVWSERDDMHAWFCEFLIESLGGTSDPFDIERTARAILLNPRSSATLVSKAAALADRSVELDSNTWTLGVKGMAKFRQGQLEVARELLEQAAVEDHWANRAQAFAFLARIANRQGNQQQAHAMLDQAEIALGLWSVVEITAPIGAPLFEYLLVREAQQEIQGPSMTATEREARAIEIQQQIVDTQPGDSHAISHLGALHYWFGNDAAHLQICRQMLAVAESSHDSGDCDRAAKLYLIRSDASENQELFQLALLAAKQAEELGRSFYLRHYYEFCRGLGAYRNGDDEEAEALFTAALEDFTPALKGTILAYRSLLYLRQNRTSDAQRDYEAASSILAMLPDDPKCSEVICDVNNLIAWIAIKEASKAFRDHD